MNELSRHIEILLLDNDCVIVPGFGGFMAHHSPAEFDEETGSFYPPQRTLGFNSQLTLNDSLLAQSYVEAYDISYPEAVLRIEEEVNEIKQSIAIEGAFEFHGIGTITLDANGVYNFTPCMAGLLTPDLYALNSFTLDELTEDVTEESNAPVVTNKTIEKRKNTLRIATFNTVRYAAAAAIILFLFVFSSIPAGVGSNNVITCSVIDTEFITSFIRENSLLNSINENPDKEKMINVVCDTKSANLQTENKKEDLYHIVLASKVSKSGARDFIAKLERQGLKEARLHECGAMRRVVYGAYKTKSEADKALNELKTHNNSFIDAWVNAEN